MKTRALLATLCIAFACAAGEARATDSDGDGVDDSVDNCVNVVNAKVADDFLDTRPWARLTGWQRDDDRDGYGNQCDWQFRSSPQTKLAAELDMLMLYGVGTNPSISGSNCGDPVFNGSADLPCAVFDLNADGVVRNSPGTAYGQAGHEDFDWLFWAACGGSDCSGSLGYPYGPFTDSAFSFSGTDYRAKCTNCPRPQPECSDNIDNDGDGKIDWIGKNAADSGGDGTGGDTGCSTRTENSECTEPWCAPDPDDAGVGLAALPDSITAWPGSFYAPGTHGCPSSSGGYTALSTANAVYQYCDITEGNDLYCTAANVTLYGVRVRSGGLSSWAIHGGTGCTGLKVLYSRIEGDRVSPANDDNPPYSKDEGHEYGIKMDTTNAGLVAQRNHFQGFADAIIFDDNICTSTGKCTVRGNVFDSPREDRGSDGVDGTSDDDHTNAVACTSNDSCNADYVTITANTMLGWISQWSHAANTNGIGMQEGSPDTHGYNNLIANRNYISGWNIPVTLEEDPCGSNGANVKFINNWFGTEYQPLNTTSALLFCGSSSPPTWGGNRWNLSGDGAWSYPTSSDDGKFWYPGDTATGAKHSADFGGSTSEPQCSDGLDNDGDGNADYPWDSGCTDAFDNIE